MTVTREIGTRLAELGARYAVLTAKHMSGGFPGLALAIALPAAHVALVESVGRKCAFLAAAVRELDVGNVEVVNGRAEAWPEGIGMHDLVVARALASLPVLIEYAAPLLELGGALVAWKGRPEPAEEANGVAAAEALGMSPPEAVPVQPFGQARGRYLYLTSKVSPTPARYPRRPGMARKRPIQASR